MENTNKPLLVHQALDKMLSAVKPIVDSEKVTINKALGRVLSKNITSPLNVPAFDNSAMDGYAFSVNDELDISKDLQLEVIGKSFAGHSFLGNEIQSGQAVRIMTGAVIPSGANVVMMQEKVEAVENTKFVKIAHEHLTNINSGLNIRPSGDDIKNGEVVFTKGQKLGAVELGVISSLGIYEIDVVRTIKVAIFSTGDELVEVGKSAQTLKCGQIYDSNRIVIKTMLAQMGIEIIDMGIVIDKPDSIEEALISATNIADVVITSGGVSVGEADFIHSLLAKLGKVNFWKIEVKPGRPLAFGTLKKEGLNTHAYFFGLPGNPVSAVVSFLQFTRRALIKISGVSPNPQPISFYAQTTTAVKKGRGRRQFVRAVIQNDNGKLRATSLENQSSGVLGSMSKANGFIVLPESFAGCEIGEMLEVQMFTELQNV